MKRNSQRKNPQKLKCPVTTPEELVIPLLEEAGNYFVTDSRAVHMLQRSLIVKIEKGFKVVEVQLDIDPDKTISFNYNFGFQVGKYVWISPVGVHDYTKERLLQSLLPNILKRKGEDETFRMHFKKTHPKE